MADMNGKVVIVTGATGGPREEEVRLLVESEARVVFGGSSAQAGLEIAKELGSAAIFQQHNVGNEAEWEAVVNLALDRVGRIDGLVNNAGITISGLITDINAETVMAGIRTNQLGPLLGIKHVVSAIGRTGGGSIVNIGSEAGVRAARDHVLRIESGCHRYEENSFCQACRRRHSRQSRRPGTNRHAHVRECCRKGGGPKNGRNYPTRSRWRSDGCCSCSNFPAV
jgi:NAD(P)-dependent dehydrogenase (short-subunit alcohol dehydrogenase family)